MRWEQENPIFAKPLPEDTISGFEYAQSLEGMKWFLGVNGQNLWTWSDTQVRLSLVQPDIRAVILATGAVKEAVTVFPGDSAPALNRLYELKKSCDGHTVIASVDEEYINLARQTKSGEDIFSLRLPVADTIIGHRGYDYRSTRVLLPGYTKDDATLQRNFVSLLQEGVQDLLRVVPSPTQLRGF